MPVTLKSVVAHVSSKDSQQTEYSSGKTSTQYVVAEKGERVLHLLDEKKGE